MKEKRETKETKVKRREGCKEVTKEGMRNEGRIEGRNK